jgi:hypothetical protein
MVVSACFPSDPAPPVHVSNSGIAVQVSLTDQDQNVAISRVEVILRPSVVLKPTDTRAWIVERQNGPAVRNLVLGQTPAGWTEVVRWQSPSLEKAAVLLIVDDGRRFLVSTGTP